MVLGRWAAPCARSSPESRKAVLPQGLSPSRTSQRRTVGDNMAVLGSPLAPLSNLERRLGVGSEALLAVAVLALAVGCASSSQRRGTVADTLTDVAPSTGAGHERRWPATVTVAACLHDGTRSAPTDTIPLSPMAKLMMTAAASVSLLTLAVVAARAVNVL